MEIFLGHEYPAIGIKCKSSIDYEKIPDFISLYDEVELLINKIGIENIKKEAQIIDTVKWNKLREIGWYFED
jgi:hypothetical protein